MRHSILQLQLDLGLFVSICRILIKAFLCLFHIISPILIKTLGVGCQAKAAIMGLRMDYQQQMLLLVLLQFA